MVADTSPIQIVPFDLLRIATPIKSTIQEVIDREAASFIAECLPKYESGELKPDEFFVTTLPWDAPKRSYRGEPLYVVIDSYADYFYHRHVGTKEVHIRVLNEAGIVALWRRVQSLKERYTEITETAASMAVHFMKVSCDLPGPNDVMWKPDGPAMLKMGKLMGLSGLENPKMVIAQALAMYERLWDASPAIRDDLFLRAGIPMVDQAQVEWAKKEAAKEAKEAKERATKEKEQEQGPTILCGTLEEILDRLSKGVSNG